MRSSLARGRGIGARLFAIVVAVGVLGWGMTEPAAAAAPVTSIWSTPDAASVPGDPVVALTFDDGPDSRWTPQVLAILRRYRIPATFFVLGGSAAGRPDLVREMAAEGHSVQNHTWSHVNLTTLSLSQYPHQIDDTSRVIQRETGQPVRCLRPPYGFSNTTVVNRLAARGLTSVGWSVDPSDYQRPGAGAIARNVLSTTRPGGIILLHDGGGDRSQTVAALPTIIEGLLSRGLRFTPLCARTTRYVDMIPRESGYWLLRSDGVVNAVGGAPALGGVASPARPLVGGAPTPSGAGYWLAAADGGVFTFGDAGFAGSLGGLRLNAGVVGMAATPSGGGYWLLGGDGGIFTYGDAGFAGSLGGLRLNAGVVGMAATPSGGGYWLVTADGGIFTFGDAPFAGSLGGLRLNAPIERMRATPSGRGYWLVGADGGIFTFGDAPFSGSGSLASAAGSQQA